MLQRSSLYLENLPSRNSSYNRVLSSVSSILIKDFFEIHSYIRWSEAQFEFALHREVLCVKVVLSANRLLCVKWECLCHVIKVPCSGLFVADRHQYGPTILFWWMNTCSPTALPLYLRENSLISLQNFFENMRLNIKAFRRVVWGQECQAESCLTAEPIFSKSLCKKEVQDSWVPFFLFLFFFSISVTSCLWDLEQRANKIVSSIRKILKSQERDQNVFTW